MDERVRLLIVDDNADDRELVLREISRDIPDFEAVEVSDLISFSQALEQDPFDVVITDYRMYCTDGLSVVRQVKAKWPDTAIIMFTGTGSEEVAVEAMKAGVDDYVLKTPRHFPRLRKAVETALRAHRQRKKLDQAELRYKALFDTVPVGLFRCTPLGKILDVNPAFALLLGTQRKDLLARNFAEFHPLPGEFERWRDELERAGSVAFLHSRFKTSEGDLRHVEIHARILRNPQTRQIYYEGSVEDITERKSAEAEREKLIGELRNALGKVNALTGMLPICSSCKKIRDKRGAWNLLETYIESHSQAHFTHSFCPDCVRRLYPEVFLDTPKI